MPGQSVTLELAPSDAGATTARIRPLTGVDELHIRERRDATRNMAPVRLETLLLEIAVDVMSGRMPAKRTVDTLLLGDRNRLVLAVLCASYGASQTLLMPCPASDCGTEHEVAFDPAAVLDAIAVGPEGKIVEVENGTRPIRMRLPTGADLSAIAAEQYLDGDGLLRRCVTEAPTIGLDTIRRAVEAEIVARDSCAEIVFASRCTACGAAISGLLDPLALLLCEMDRYGGVLSELDHIARAYHWSEAEILALPAHRRRQYLAIVSENERPEPRRRIS